MSHFSVRLMQAVLIVAAAAMVGGSAKLPDQPEELAKQPSVTAIPQVAPREQPKPGVSDLSQEGECSAPIKGEGMSSLLLRLSKTVDPKLPADEAEDTQGPSGKLYLEAKTRNPNGLNSERLGIADSICVVRTSSGAGKPVWWIHYQGYVPRTADR